MNNVIKRTVYETISSFNKDYITGIEVREGDIVSIYTKEMGVSGEMVSISIYDLNKLFEEVGYKLVNRINDKQIDLS